MLVLSTFNFSGGETDEYLRLAPLKPKYYYALSLQIKLYRSCLSEKLLLFIMFFLLINSC